MKTLSLEATQLAWETARLKYKLEPRQKEAYDHIKRSPAEEIFFLLCHRGFGKTFLGSILGIEVARKEIEGSILIVSGTLKKLRTIVKPTFEQILRDCPEAYKPKYHSQDSCYEFPSGIRVHLCAAEKGHIEDLRGIHKVILVLIDEAAFFGDEDDSYPLDYVIEYILNPMFIRTASTPRTIMMTTPPDVPNHPCKKYFEAAQLANCVAIFDADHSDIPPEKLAEQKRRSKDPLAWEREMMCKWVIDKNRLIVPEWDSNKYVREVSRDQLFDFYHRYEFLDTGVRDFTINGFGYYNFRSAQMVIEDEVLLTGDRVRTDILADETKSKEKALGYNAWFLDQQKNEWKLTGKDRMYRRIGDNNNLIILNDLSGPKHNLPFMATTKGVLNSNTGDEDFGMVNELRLWVNAGRLIVHPRCKYLIGCLENGIWDKSKKAFARSTTYGHFDGLAALCYLVRHVDTQTNPIPANHGLSLQTHNLLPGKVESKNYQVLRKALKIQKIGRTTDDFRKRANV